MHISSKENLSCKNKVSKSMSKSTSQYNYHYECIFCEHNIDNVCNIENIAQIYNQNSIQNTIQDNTKCNNQDNDLITAHIFTYGFPRYKEKSFDESYAAGFLEGQKKGSREACLMMIENILNQKFSDQTKNFMKEIKKIYNVFLLRQIIDHLLKDEPLEEFTAHLEEILLFQ